MIHATDLEDFVVTSNKQDSKQEEKTDRTERDLRYK